MKLRSQRRRSSAIPLTLFACLFAQLVLHAAAAGQAPPPIPPRGRPAPAQPECSTVAIDLQEVRRHLDATTARSPDGEHALEVARYGLTRAQEKLRLSDCSGADRMVEAADAFLHVAGHSAHLAVGPKGPVPPQREIAEHLQRVYFRLQQADFFARSSDDPKANELPSVARKLYEKSRKAYDESRWFDADEYAKSAEDIVRGLESMAQAAVPQTQPHQPAPPAPPR